MKSKLDLQMFRYKFISFQVSVIIAVVMPHLIVSKLC